MTSFPIQELAQVPAKEPESGQPDQRAMLGAQGSADVVPDGWPAAQVPVEAPGLLAAVQRGLKQLALRQRLPCWRALQRRAPVGAAGPVGPACLAGAILLCRWPQRTDCSEQHPAGAMCG